MRPAWALAQATLRPRETARHSRPVVASLNTMRMLTHARFLRAVMGRLSEAWRGLEPRLPGRADKTRAGILAGALWLRLATRQPIPVPRLRLLINGSMNAIQVREEGEFVAAFEVFAADDYGIDLSTPVRRVLDLGANIGFAAMLLAERYPDAEIVCVEAAPDTFAVLEANIAGIERIRALNLAVGTDGPVFVDLAAPSVERQMTEHGTEVPGISLHRLLDDLGWEYLDLLKIDVEGAEFTIFADKAMSRIGAVVGEIHEAHAPVGYTDAGALLPKFRVAVRPTISNATVFHAVRA
jgi:FkbM family methyltransferase